MLHIDEKNFRKEVLESDKPVVIDFWAEWCGPCRMMAPVFEELSKEFDGKLKFAKLDTQEHPQIASQFSIQGIPTLVVASRGKEITRIVGLAPKDVLKEKIEEAI